MEIGPSLVANSQAPELAEPGERALHHPPVSAQPGAAFDTPPGDAGLNAPPPQRATAAPVVVSLVGVELARSLARGSPALPDGRHGINHGLQHRAVMHVGSRQPHRERDAVCIREDVTLRSGLAPIRRVRAGRLAPLFAGTEALSSAARLKSMALRRPSLSRSTRWSFAQTPAACHPRSLRQQVMPEPQPISCGSISHGMPERKTKRMPVSAARSGTRGRPPFGFGGSRGSSGSTTAQSASDTRGLLMPR